MLWVTGGPGGSGLISLMQELGPCRINDDGTGTSYNEFGWTKNSSVIFIDQPVGTGFSYNRKGRAPSDSYAGAKDIYVFLQIFLNDVFPKKKELDFHIAGSSYAGHFIPPLSSEIIDNNISNPDKKIRLKSIAIGNGYVSPRDTISGFYDTLCTTISGVEQPIFNKTKCNAISEAMPRCLKLFQACYDYPDEIICHATEEFCSGHIRSLFDIEIVEDNRDPFDITRKCDDGDYCYEGFGKITKFMQSPAVFKALGVDTRYLTNFSIASEQVEEIFMQGNDPWVTTVSDIGYALESGVDVLIYTGKLDLICNLAGNIRWSESMEWPGQAEYRSKLLLPWNYTTTNGLSQKAGEQKSAKFGGTRLDFVTIDNAGHLVPFQQPEVAQYMINKWLANEEF